MSEASYTLIITEAERTALARSLGTLVTKLINLPVNAPPTIDNGGTQAARAVLSPPANPPSPFEVRDRWARDRKGKEVPNPKGSYAIAVRIWKTERRDLSDRLRLKVTWQNLEKGYTDAACWDENLFPFLAVASKNPQPTTIYLTQKDAYLNVVGVRA